VNACVNAYVCMYVRTCVCVYLCLKVLHLSNWVYPLIIDTRFMWKHVLLDRYTFNLDDHMALLTNLKAAASLENYQVVYFVEFRKPQINFQSDETNARLVLAASKAYVQGGGFPLWSSLPSDSTTSATEAMIPEDGSTVSASECAAAVDRVGNSAGGVGMDAVAPVAPPAPTSLGYYKREVTTYMIDATVFVAPVDVDVEGQKWGSIWVPDDMLEISEDAGLPRMDSGFRRQQTMRFDGGLPVDMVRQQGASSNWYSKIVEPGRLCFNWTYDVAVEGLVKSALSRGIYVADNHEFDWKRRCTQATHLYMPEFKSEMTSTQYHDLIEMLHHVLLAQDRKGGAEDGEEADDDVQQLPTEHGQDNSTELDDAHGPDTNDFSSGGDISTRRSAVVHFFLSLFCLVRIFRIHLTRDVGV
jgi:hypothetical protein